MILEFLRNEPGRIPKYDLVTEVIEHSGFSESQIVVIIDEMVRGRQIYENDGFIYLHEARE